MSDDRSAAQRERVGLEGPRRAVARTAESTIDAVLNGEEFDFDREMRVVAAAYAGNIAALHRDLLEVAPDPERVMSYRQLAEKFRSEVPNDARAHIRGGIKGFKKTSLYVRWSAAARNDVWQIDATQLDIWVKPRGTESAIRPWLLLVIDDYSRVIQSAAVMLHEYNAADSAAAVHRAIRVKEVTLPDGTTTEVGGIPGRILCDNALQFTGELMTTVAQELSFVMWAVAVYAGEKKGKVEGAIRDVNEQLCMRLPGYANPNRKTMSMRDQLRGAPTDALDEVQFLDELARWIEWKNNQPHPAMRAKSRYQVWADDPTTLRVADEEQLQCATVPVANRGYIFHKEGFRITRNGKLTVYPDELLAGRVGDKFHLRHLPGETAWVDAYELDGAFVTRCWDSTLLSREQKVELERNRFNRYRTTASEVSAAVELRAIAAADPSDGEANPLAVAHAHAIAPPSDDLVRSSLGLGPGHAPDAGDVVDAQAVEDTAELPLGTSGEDLAELDSIAAIAVEDAGADGVDAGPAKKPGARKRKPAKSNRRTKPKADAAASKEVA